MFQYMDRSRIVHRLSVSAMLPLSGVRGIHFLIPSSLVFALQVNGKMAVAVSVDLLAQPPLLFQCLSEFCVSSHPVSAYSSGGFLFQREIMICTRTHARVTLSCEKVNTGSAFLEERGSSVCFFVVDCHIVYT